MTRIRATCPTCGEVELRPDEIELHVVGADPDDVQDGSSYIFDCPACCHEISKPADGRIARLLTSGGVPVTCTGDPEIEAVVAAAMGRITHPEGIVVGPALTIDDLLDFHELLQTPDWFDELRALTR
jgi:predicted RNA-binding Zn-ribbon protein involved in translation (DUF1610 family)